MNFKEELIKEFKKGSRMLKIIGLLHAKTRLHLSVTSLNENNLSLDTPVTEAKIRFQPLYLEGNEWKRAPYRLDNCHRKDEIHSHWWDEPTFYAFNLKTLKDVFTTILGTEFKEEEFRENSIINVND